MSKSDLETELDYYQWVCKIGHAEIGPSVFRHLDAQNDKSSAILTYLSLMSAVLGTIIIFTAQIDGSGIFSGLLVGILMAFVSLAVFSLRTIVVTSPATTKGQEDDPIPRIVMVARNRRRTHNFVVKATSFTTLLLIAVLAVWGGSVLLAAS